MKDWLEQDTERTLEDYFRDAITEEEAILALLRLGFDPREAKTLCEDQVA